MSNNSNNYDTNKMDYTGTEEDVAIITNNVQVINDALDSINSVEKIIPNTWKSNAATKYEETVTSDIITPIEGLKESLNELTTTLTEALEKYKETENSIQDDAEEINTEAPDDATISDEKPSTNDQPTQPSNPTQPSKPTQPSNPTQPSTPDNTTTTPSTPTTDGSTSTVTQPDNPFYNQQHTGSNTSNTSNKSSSDVGKGVASTIIGIGAVGAAGAVGYGLYNKKKREQEDEEEDTTNDEYDVHIPEENISDEG